jgi:glycerophosphoryl diester phosphodiesterase
MTVSIRERRVALSVALLVLGGGAVLSASNQSVDSAQAPDGADRFNPFRTGRTLVIPHAGGDGMYPENTMVAYERSLALGGDVIDLDVRLTRDGVLVALHDSTVDRTTDGRGQVAEMSFAELQQLDAGWSFTAGGRHPFRGQGLQVPSVRQILERFAGVLTTLDLKDQRVTAVAPICDLIEELRIVDNIYVGVDTTEQVMEFRKRCPQVRTSGTSAERQAARAARERGDLTYRSPQTVSQPSYVADDGTIRVTQDFIEAAHARNVAVLTWVVDDPATMRQLVEWGVDGIYTRRPDLLLDIVSSTLEPTAASTDAARMPNFAFD